MGRIIVCCGFVGVQMPTPFSISAVITCHNRQELARRAVRSVMRQRAFREIVLVDDASDQPITLDGLTDRRLKLLRSDRNEGVSASRNKGVREVTSSHVMFIDDDDFLLPWAGWLARRWLSATRGGDLEGTIHVGGVAVGGTGRRLEFRRPPVPPQGRSGASTHSCWSPGSRLRQSRRR